jgi:hypothetical protein
LPPRGGAVTPWLTTVIDAGSRALVGWAISITLRPTLSLHLVLAARILIVRWPSL